MDVGVTRFLRALTQFVMNVFLLFMIAETERCKFSMFLLYHKLLNTRSPQR